MFCALLITDTSFVIFKACAQLSKRACLSSVITDFKSKSWPRCCSRSFATKCVYVYCISLTLYTNIMISLMRIKSPAWMANKLEARFSFTHQS